MTPEELPDLPIEVANGRVAVMPLPYKPSERIQVISRDKADLFEGYVLKVSPLKFGYSKKKGQLTGMTFPHDVKRGDRVIFKPVYHDEDWLKLSDKSGKSVEVRLMDPWDIQAILTKDRPEGFTNPLDGRKTSDDIRSVITV